MAKPIYVSWRAKPTEAWYQLSEQERNALFEKLRTSQQQVGGKTVIMCSSRWGNEQWPFFGVEEYPDIEAMQRHIKFQEDLNWYRYVTGESLMGTAWQLPV